MSHHARLKLARRIGVALAVAVVSITVAAGALASSSTTTTTLSVASAGNDANACTQSAPCATITHALTVGASAYSASNAVAISVGAGTFDGGQLCPDLPGQHRGRGTRHHRDRRNERDRRVHQAVCRLHHQCRALLWQRPHTRRHLSLHCQRNRRVRHRTVGNIEQRDGAGRRNTGRSTARLGHDAGRSTGHDTNVTVASGRFVIAKARTTTIGLRMTKFGRAVLAGRTPNQRLRLNLATTVTGAARSAHSVLLPRKR